MHVTKALQSLIREFFFAQQLVDLKQPGIHCTVYTHQCTVYRQNQRAEGACHHAPGQTDMTDGQTDRSNGWTDRQGLDGQLLATIQTAMKQF